MKPFLIALICVSATAFSQVKSPDRAPAKDNSVEAEMASFEIHDDFEVSLFADETMGIANPIAIQWDDRGRLWVLTTSAYAQLKPAEIPNDKLIILEDSDGDGNADTSTVFADGLEMPTGFALGHGGVYLAEGPDLVHLKDTDGDNKSDRKNLILTGFGTGDTHQNISNFTFDSGGFLYFSQGLHAFSHVETPWGVSRGDHAGFWRFDRRITKLDPFCFPTMMSANPCGIALDQWGALFVKSNGPHLGFATPGLIPTTHPKELMQFAQIGATTGKSMGAEIVETEHLPEWIQNHALISGYFARQVMSLPLIEKGAGFEVVEPVKIMSAEHQSFRPVDIRIGPDGGIYVADWFNPVINHYQVSLRHPHRDYDHGRIWRITAKNRSLVKRPIFDAANRESLFEHLRSPERWIRDQARQHLFDSDPTTFSDQLVEWALKLDPKSKTESHALVEAAGILESHRIVEANILDRLEASTEPHARAVVARMIARAADPISDSAERLSRLLRDPHPRPRLEAVVACGNIPTSDSMRFALIALDSKVDKNIDHALQQSVHALAPHWLADVESGAIEFEKPEHLAFALTTFGGERSAVIARKKINEMNPSDPNRVVFLQLLASSGIANDLSMVLAHPHENASLLNAMIDSWPIRRLVPTPPFQPRLGELLNSENSEIKIASIKLAGLWSAGELGDSIEKLAFDSATASAVRGPALLSVARIRGKSLSPKLQELAFSTDTHRMTALEALAIADANAASDAAVKLIQTTSKNTDLLLIINPVLKTGVGAAHFKSLLSKTEMPSETTQQIVNVLTRIGRLDLNVYAKPKDVGNADSDDYDAKRVATIVAAVQAGDGDETRGKAVYDRAQLTCVACHQIKKIGGVLGPSLDAVGAGLPLDQIVESVLWPARQLKEGYFATAITTVDEQVHTGYIDREAAGAIWLRDSATQKLRPVSQHQILKQEQIGSLMPAGLTATLKPAELIDLIAFLASLKG